ncbi:MAG: hypothetical protein ACYCW6_06830 [Candidatus Xenobia bacterium]
MVIDLEARPAVAARARALLSPRLIVSMVVGLIYFWTNANPDSPFSYTIETARALLAGHLGLTQAPPWWMNEYIHRNGMWYMVLPLGSVITMLPVALIKNMGFIVYSATLAGWVGFGCTWMLDKLVASYSLPPARRWFIVLCPVLASCAWMNLTLGGSWNINIGIGMFGELMALVYLLADRRPWLAGLGFALACGHRTELAITAPIFLLLVGRARRDIIAFLTPAVLLAIPTMLYNDARFGSPFDFGYAYLSGLPIDPRVTHGLFSWHYIPMNAYESLLRGWKHISQYPWWVPVPFGGSVILSSPWLLSLPRRGAVHSLRKILAMVGIVVVFATLWCYCNPGGWEFSYRYFMVVLPWVTLLQLESQSDNPAWWEWSLFGLAVVINAYACYLFFWTKYVTP